MTRFKDTRGIYITINIFTKKTRKLQKLIPGWANRLQSYYTRKGEMWYYFKTTTKKLL